MDFFDEGILAALKDGKPRGFTSASALQKNKKKKRRKSKFIS
jgi:hypothetical protein